MSFGFFSQFSFSLPVGHVTKVCEKNSNNKKPCFTSFEQFPTYGETQHRSLFCFFLCLVFVHIDFIFSSNETTFYFEKKMFEKKRNFENAIPRKCHSHAFSNEFCFFLSDGTSFFEHQEQSREKRHVHVLIE